MWLPNSEVDVSVARFRAANDQGEVERNTRKQSQAAVAIANGLTCPFRQRRPPVAASSPLHGSAVDLSSGRGRAV